MASSSVLTPEVTWAQRSSSSDPEKNFLYVTISASDVPKEMMKIDLQPSRITFKGYSHTKKVTYEVELGLYAEIDPGNSHIKHSARDVEMVLRKKELKSEFWPRLLQESKKMHFLKTDFDKWVDEDEQESKDDDDYLSQFGGGPGAGSGFEGLDFSKLQNAAGGMPEMPTGEDDEEDDEGEDKDDEMPDLEDEDVEEVGSAKPAAAGAKTTGGARAIEEVE